MRVCVTGAAGFIGSHLVEALAREGCEVVAIDCLTDFYPPERKRAHVAGLLRHPRLDWRWEDLLEADLATLLDGCDAVLHQAGQPGVRASWGDRFRNYVERNVLATQRLLEACVTAGVRRVVYASTSSVYGDAPPPWREDGPTRPLSPYGVSKLAGEGLCACYERRHGLQVVSLRYFTVYGPRQRPDMAVARFIDAILRGRPIPLLGDGAQARDFTYVDDVVAANLAALRRPVCGPVNVGGGGPVPLRDVIAALAAIAAEHGLPEPTIAREAPRDAADPDLTWADLARARRELGYQSTVDLAEGLRRQFAWQLALTGRSSEGG